MNYKTITSEAVAVCIACGCTDLRACAGGCCWLRVSYALGVGVCSACPTALASWDSGNRESDSSVLAAPIEPCAKGAA